MPKPPDLLGAEHGEENRYGAALRYMEHIMDDFDRVIRNAEKDENVGNLMDLKHRRDELMAAYGELTLGNPEPARELFKNAASARTWLEAAKETHTDASEIQKALFEIFDNPEN